MELAKYDLSPQEQLAVSLYLKSMNKTQAARDAGYATPTVFYKDNVKAAIAEQLSIRAERLRVGGDWVLGELRAFMTAAWKSRRLRTCTVSPLVSSSLTQPTRLRRLPL